MSAKQFHLGWFLQGSSVQAWGEAWTGHIGTSWMQPTLFLDMARSLERACFDYILLEDSSYVGESFNGSTEIYLQNGIAVPRQDPSVVAALDVGMSPPGSASFRPSAPMPIRPTLLARLMATLDQVSVGRAGWNAVTGSSDYAAMNFRPSRHAGARSSLRHGRRIHGMWSNKLWASWEPGAILADARKAACWWTTPRCMAVASRRPVFSGRAGRSTRAPAPQGRPVIAQAGVARRAGGQFASQHADTIVVHTRGAWRR